MKCPGQDSRYWKPGAIFEANCPQCKQTVEFFKDDTTRKCPGCGHRFVNPNLDFGCAAYCEFAEQCIGTLPPELIAQKEDLLKDRVAIEMKRYYKKDFRQIGYVSRVARYAEKIGKIEGGNLAIILTAAYLYDMGQTADGAAAYAPQEILVELGANTHLINTVCTLIKAGTAHDQIQDLNHQIVLDARHIADLEDKQKTGPMSPSALTNTIEESLFTPGGRQEARKVLGLGVNDRLG